MKKIMFNDKYGLTDAVLQGRKTMTRRIVTDGTEHKHEIKMLKLEQETPKRFEQGEWVSGQTLAEIIKTLVTMIGEK